MRRAILGFTLILLYVGVLQAQVMRLEHGVRLHGGYSSYILPLVGVGAHPAGGVSWVGMMRLSAIHSLELSAGVFTTGYSFKESSRHFVSIPLGAQWRASLWSSLPRLIFRLGLQLEVQLHGASRAYFTGGKFRAMPLAFRTRNPICQEAKLGNTWPIVPGGTVGLSYLFASIPVELGAEFSHDLMARSVHKRMEPLAGMLTELNYLGFSATYYF